jgi:hypothetical protein
MSKPMLIIAIGCLLFGQWAGAGIFVILALLFGKKR